MQTKAYAAENSEGLLVPHTITRREPTPTDVAIDILFCGICHSDLHCMHNDWGNSLYPMVPGHEIVGRVSRVGQDVSRFKKGQLVGVGCMVDSCRQCAPCKDHEEQFCESGMTLTYNSEEARHGGITYGGYSEHIVVDQDFVLNVSEDLSPAAAAPLLCAGITTYSPLKRANVGPGTRVGVVGLGGLGHIGVKIARAMGAEVIVISHSPHKVRAAKELGANEVLISTNSEEMAAYRNQFDFILDTVSAKHDINAYLDLLRHDGTLAQVGLPAEPLEVSVFPLIFKRLKFTGSLIGGIKETQEMLDFCALHNITADIELVDVSELNDAMARLEQGDVKYRFVIDMASLT